MPEVSVLIPATTPMFLDMAICSVLSQTFPDFELLISDGSENFVLESLVAKWADSRIKYLHLPAEQYAGQRQHLLMNRAQGRYLKFCSEEDFLMPKSIEFLLAAMKGLSTPIAFHYSTLVNEVGAPNGTSIPDSDRLVPIGNMGAIPGAMIAKLIAGSGINPVGNSSSVMVDREVLTGCPNPFEFDGRATRSLRDETLYMNMANQGLDFGCAGYIGNAARIHETHTSEVDRTVGSAKLYEREMFGRWGIDAGIVDEELYWSAIGKLRVEYEKHVEQNPELLPFLELGGKLGTDGLYFGEQFKSMLANADSIADQNVPIDVR